MSLPLWRVGIRTDNDSVTLVASVAVVTATVSVVVVTVTTAVAIPRYVHTVAIFATETRHCDLITL